MATALEARAMNFATETKLAEPIQKWLIVEGIVSVEDIVQICHDEASWTQVATPMWLAQHGGGRRAEANSTPVPFKIRTGVVRGGGISDAK